MNAREIIAMAGADPEAQINLLAVNYNNCVRLLSEVHAEIARLRVALVAVDNPLLELLSNAEDGHMPPQEAWAAASTAYDVLRAALAESR